MITFFWCCQFPISLGENLDSVDGSYDDTHDTGMYIVQFIDVNQMISYVIDPKKLRSFSFKPKQYP